MSLQTVVKNTNEPVSIAEKDVVYVDVWFHGLKCGQAAAPAK